MDESAVNSSSLFFIQCFFKGNNWRSTPFLFMRRRFLLFSLFISIFSLSFLVLSLLALIYSVQVSSFGCSPKEGENKGNDKKGTIAFRSSCSVAYPPATPPSSLSIFSCLVYFIFLDTAAIIFLVKLITMRPSLFFFIFENEQSVRYI